MGLSIGFNSLFASIQAAVRRAVEVPPPPPPPPPAPPPEVQQNADVQAIAAGKSSFDESVNGLAGEPSLDDATRAVAEAIAGRNKHTGALPTATVADASAVTNETGDPLAMNPADHFRNSLQPDERVIYDQQLAQLRSDPRIHFDFKPGSKDDLATRELALRGIVAGSFGRPEDLEDSIRAATNSKIVTDDDGTRRVEHAPEEGKFEIQVYPKEIHTADADPTPGDEGGEVEGGLKTKTGIAISQDFLFDVADANDNAFIHEFSHCMQGINPDPEGATRAERYPPSFGDENAEAFEAQFTGAPMQDFLKKVGLNHELGGESFPTIQNLFRQRPEELQKAAPELYEVMKRWSGVDPIAGRLTPDGAARYPTPSSSAPPSSSGDATADGRIDAQVAALPTIGPGYSGDAKSVTDLQNLLVQYQLIPREHTNGVYDDGTQVAVRAFQAQHGLPPTGVVDARTWSAMLTADGEHYYAPAVTTATTMQREAGMRIAG